MARILVLDTLKHPSNSGTANITLSSDETTTMPTVNINGGQIDSTTIGASNPTTVAATTLTASGNATVGGTFGVTGATTLSSTAAITGNTTVGGTLVVTGSTTLGTTTVGALSSGAYTINGIYMQEYANATYGDQYSYGDGSTMRSLTNGTNQGVRNNAFGATCLVGTTTGNDNTAMGYRVMRLSGSGDYLTRTGNTGVGSGALETTTGDKNTGIGYWAAGPTTGDNNTVIGYLAGQGGSPSGAIGTNSNRICLGDNNVTNAYIKVDWTVTSDERDKADIVPMEHGLDVVENINPINFVWDTRTDYWDIADTTDEDGNLNITKHESDGSKKQSDNFRTGFSAQNVKSALDAIGWEGHAVVNSEDPDNLKITHTNIIPFMVNAIKELSTKIKALETK